jgi:hypothetical protein
MPALTAALLAALSLASAPAATGSEGADPDRVSIVYTGANLGVHGSWSTLNEASPLYDPRNRGEIAAAGLNYEIAAIRRDRWYIWSAGTPLTAKAAKELFAGGGISVRTPGRVIPALISDYSVVFQQPNGDSAWLVPWLEGKLRAMGETPDVRQTRGALFQARSASGADLWIFSVDSSPPPPDVLHNSDGWRWVGLADTKVLRGKRESRLVALARRFGGFPLHQEALRIKEARKAIRVDSGGLVDNVNDTISPQALEDTLSELPGMGLDALVPYKYELWLPPAELARVAGAVPLVAANLTGPPGIPVQPYIIREQGETKVAIVGIADSVTLAQYGLLGARTGWKADDPEKALRKTLEELKLDGVDAVVLVTNVAPERLSELREACVGCAALISRQQYHREQSYRERFEPVPGAEGRHPLPWLVVGAGSSQVGILDLEFKRDATGKSRLMSVANEGKYVSDDLPAAPEKLWRDFTLYSEFFEARRDTILPDVRRLSARDKRFVDKDGDPLILMTNSQWSALAAAALRQAAGAELAIIHTLHRGTHIVGDISVFVAESWLPNGLRVATAQLTGADIKRLVATDPERRKLSFGGYDPETHLIGGRPLQDAERYQVVTGDTLAVNEAFQNVFRDQARLGLRLRGDRIYPGKPDERVSLNDVVMARLTEMKKRHGGFPNEYLDELAQLLSDDGHKFEPRWTVAFKPCEGTFQQLSITNRESFGAVRNSRVNAPNNTSIRGKGNIAVTYETPDLDWENRALLEYQRAEIQLPAPASTLTQEAADNVGLTSEFRLKVFKLQTQRSAVEMVPFINGNYLTEFTPTEDPNTKQLNPRRSEFNGIAGVVLYPGTWLKELRLGAIARQDIAKAGKGVEPGAQMAGQLEVPLGGFAWTLDADVKNYFRTPQDTPDDLGIVAQIGTGLRLPLFGGFSLRVGVDALWFTGKLGTEPPAGSSLVPAVGVAYNATWKPGVGLVY